jgi:hypothetical protein
MFVVNSLLIQCFSGGIIFEKTFHPFIKDVILNVLASRFPQINPRFWREIPSIALIIQHF